MPIKNLEQIQREVAADKKNTDYMIEWRRQENQKNKAKSWLIAVLCAVFMFIATKSKNLNNGKVVFVMVSIAGIVAYRMTLKESAFIWHNERYGNAFTLLFENHFPNMEHLRDLDEKRSIFRANNFFIKYPNFSISNNFFYSGEIISQKITFIEFNKKTLLISILENKNLIINDLYIAKRTEAKLTGNLKLPTKQKFDYFPELTQYFDFYTEQKIETAQFLQVNEDILLQITKFTKYNLAIVFYNNQVHCLLRGVDTDLFADVDYEVNLDDKEIAAYFQQLEELSNFINLLQQIR